MKKTNKLSKKLENTLTVCTKETNEEKNKEKIRQNTHKRIDLVEKRIALGKTGFVQRIACGETGSAWGEAGFVQRSARGEIGSVQRIARDEAGSVRGNPISQGVRGITLIALVVTIIVLLILARSKHTNDNRTKWNTKYGKKSSR